MRGTHMLVYRDINQASLASATNPIRGETTTTLSNLQLRVPYLGFSASQMNEIQSTGFAWYNALEASLKKRLSHGLQFLASYTFSRDLANVNGSTTGFNGGTLLGDQNSPRSNYGPDSFVRPHRLVFSGLYEMPSPKDPHSLAGQLLGSWRLSGVITIQSGHLLPLINNTTTNAYGVTTDFAEIVPGCNLSTNGSVTHRLNNWINQQCLAPYPVIGDDGVATGFGNSGMGILHGPSQADTDIAASKLFYLKWPNEKTNLEFRAEAFNIFNHPIFSDPSNNVAAATFGSITTTASNPRILQFALTVKL